MRTLEIKLINGKWTVNGKSFRDLSYQEIMLLDNFITSFQKYGDKDEFLKGSLGIESNLETMPEYRRYLEGKTEKVSNLA